MKSRRAIIVLLAIAGGLLAGFLVWPWAREAWHIHRLREGSIDEQIVAARALRAMSSTRAFPLYFEILQTPTAEDSASGPFELRREIEESIGEAPPSVAKSVADASLVDGSIALVEHLKLESSRRVAVRHVVDRFLGGTGGDRFRVLARYRADEARALKEASEVESNPCFRSWFALVRLASVDRGASSLVLEELFQLFESRERPESIGDLILTLAPLAGDDRASAECFHRVLRHPDERVRLRLLASIRNAAPPESLAWERLERDPSPRFRARAAFYLVALSKYRDLQLKTNPLVGLASTLEEDDVIERTFAAAGVLLLTSIDKDHLLRKRAWEVLMAFPPGPYVENAPEIGLSRDEALLQHTRMHLYDSEFIIRKSFGEPAWQQLHDHLSGETGDK
ncbi:MAG: hypothetical protein AAF517_09205 [Planctomycetota bacterium]